MSYGARGFVALWLVSAAPLFLPHASDWLAPCSISALWLTPWMLYLTAPARSSRKLGRHGARAELSLSQALLALLPLAVLIARVDLALETNLSSIAATFLLTALLCAPWILALRLARTSIPARILALGGWFAIFVGAPLLRAVLEQAGAPLFGSAPGWLARGLCPLSPLAWLARRWSRDGASLELDPPYAALCLGILLCVAVALLERARSARTDARNGGALRA